MKDNDVQRMKDLANRVVAMSPEPPPFPEEVTMTTAPARKTTIKPLTVFAAAVVIVLLGFGIPLLLMNGGEPPVAGPDTTTTTSTTTPVETTTTAPNETTTTTLAANPSFVDAIVFLTQTPENSFLGNPALVSLATTVEVEEGGGELEGVRNALNLLGSPGFNPPSSFENVVPAGVEALVVRRADGTDNALIIEMNEAFADGAGGLLADFTMLNQLIYTATAHPDIEEVHFIVNNQPVTQFGSEGLDISSSLNRETFQENLALIYLTSPILPNGDGNVVVEGISNTYEASMALRVLDGDGNTVHEEFTTATCGSGCWGEYLFVLDSDLFEADSTVQIFEYSAEDGDPQNIISIPYNDGQYWFLPEELENS